MDHETAITTTPTHPTGVAETPFTLAELESMHRQDIAAGRAVVVLMCSIFLVGVLIYTIVAISVAF